MFKRFVGLLILVPLLARSAGAATFYPIDRNHSTIGFAASVLKLSKVTGKFADFKGFIIVPDARDLTTSTVEVTIRSTSISTGLPDRDQDLRGAGFFETEKYPEITFKSKAIRRSAPPPKAAGKSGPNYVVAGTFTMHGVSRELSIPMNVVAAKEVLAAEAHLTLNRRDYGISWNRLMEDGAQFVDDEVEIDLYLLTKSGKPYELGTPIPEMKPGR
ncbi:MAG TPA: YceI family protein [Thermoanaerobaculia bacterium]|nr:YceI family protein [Thermoanaerobaculia bacterium]